MVFFSCVFTYESFSSNSLEISHDDVSANFDSVSMLPSGRVSDASLDNNVSITSKKVSDDSLTSLSRNTRRSTIDLSEYALLTLSVFLFNSEREMKIRPNVDKDNEIDYLGHFWLRNRRKSTENETLKRVGQFRSHYDWTEQKKREKETPDFSLLEENAREIPKLGVEIGTQTSFDLLSYSDHYQNAKRNCLKSYMHLMDKFWGLTLSLLSLGELVFPLVALYYIRPDKLANSSCAQENQDYKFGIFCLTAGVVCTALKRASTLFVIIRKQLISLANDDFLDEKKNIEEKLRSESNNESAKLDEEIQKDGGIDAMLALV